MRVLQNTMPMDLCSSLFLRYWGWDGTNGSSARPREDSCGTGLKPRIGWGSRCYTVFLHHKDAAWCSSKCKPKAIQSLEPDMPWQKASCDGNIRHQQLSLRHSSHLPLWVPLTFAITLGWHYMAVCCTIIQPVYNPLSYNGSPLFTKHQVQISLKIETICVHP